MLRQLSSRIRARFRHPPALADQRGAAAVEFALVAMPFLFLLVAITEMGLIFVGNYCLSNATLALARQLRVGQIEAAGASATTSNGSLIDLADFKKAICSKMLLVSNATCLTALQVDVRTQNSFGTASAPNPIVKNNFTTSGFCFYSGTQGNIVTLRTYYLWPLFAVSLVPSLTNATSVTTPNGTTAGNYYVLMSAEIFKNEPNTASTNTGAGC